MKVYFTDNMISSPYHTENKAEQFWDCKRSVTLFIEPVKKISLVGYSPDPNSPDPNAQFQTVGI